MSFQCMEENEKNGKHLLSLLVAEVACQANVGGANGNKQYITFKIVYSVDLMSIQQFHGNVYQK